ncbi:PBSX family phage terminase large subunit [Limosilactobacillus fermentum]|uniref:PBSX family phage terminase large subunit n=1 Tax=Limosilactobacillus fermentum TaxID=1613 RepID=UPI00187FF1F7|nr:PBSX family phage terminase large subunit [Limosilactobacillus fermentum]MBE8118004.1 PBSX family phage terminase large subunit [Limosilactobacillus fermentum]
MEAVLSLNDLVGQGYNDFWHDKHFYRVVKGSRGSKKSMTTALNFIYRIMRYHYANLLVVRRFSNTNHDSTYAVLKKAIHLMKVDRLFKCNEGRPEITYIPTGQRIIFRGLDDPLKITSVDVDTGILCWAWFEECYEIESEDKFDTVVESIRGTYDDPDFFKQITLTFNPWSDRHWLKRAFFDDKTRHQDVFARTTTFRINEWLDDKDRVRYLDLYRTNPRRARIVCDGDWGVAEGLIFENFDVKDFDWSKKIKQIGTVVTGLDFGFSHDPTTLPSSIYDEDKKELWVFDELYKTGLVSSEIVQEIKLRGLQKATITADSATPMAIEEIKRGGVRRIRPMKKGKDSIETGISFMQGLKIHIHPRCKHTIEEFNTYVYSKDKEGNWLNKPVDKNNHIIDAIRYSLMDYYSGAYRAKAKQVKGIYF